MKKNLALASMAMTLLGAITPSWAAISLETSITGLQFEATDLNPNDNVAAEIHWLNNTATYTNLITFIEKTPGGNVAEDYQAVQGIFTPLSSVSQYADSRATSFMDATGMRLTSSTSSATSEVYANAWTGARYENPNPLYVAPFTRVTVRGELSFVFKSDDFCQISGGPFGASACGLAHGGIDIELSRHEGQPSGNADYYLSADFDTIRGSDTLRTPFLLTLDNNSAQATYFGFSAGGGQWINVSKAPVPEPTALACLAIGLVTLVVARRNRSGR